MKDEPIKNHRRYEYAEKAGNDDLEIRQGLRACAESIALTQAPPPAAHVWLRVKHRRNQEDLRRAEQPMRIMQSVAIACVLILITAWLTQHTGAYATLTAARTPLLAAACATIAAGIAACWTMLHASRGSS